MDIWVNAGSSELQIRRKLAALRRKYEAHGMQQLAQWNRDLDDSSSCCGLGITLPETNT